MKWPGRFIRGDVKLVIYGSNAGRFFQLCAANGIRIEHLVRTGSCEYICHMDKQSVWDSRPYYRKAGVRCRITGKRGLPFLMFRYRKRIAFPLALCIVLYLMGFCSRFLWKIEINGNSYLTDELIISYLKDNNASFGTAKSNLDCDEIELMLRDNFEEIIWASVAIEGTSLIIELQEAKEVSDSGDYIVQGTVYSSEQPSVSYQIVADRDALIVSIVTRSGLAVVTEGDEVAAGDVLVEGTQEIYGDDESTKLWYAAIPDADITGEAVYEYEDSITAETTVKSYGKSVISGIYFQLPTGRFEINLPAEADENTEILESYYQAHLTEQFYLPFGIGITRMIPVEINETRRTDDEALALAESNLSKYLESLEEDGVVILSKTVTMHKEGEHYIVEGEITARERIGTVVISDSGEEDNP